MTGRLNKVDLDSDLVFVLLDRRAMSARELVTHLQAVDTDPFVFDDVDTDPHRLRGLLGFFRTLGYLEWGGEFDDELVLTGTGEYMADALDKALTDQQRTAVDDVCDDREVVEA